MQEKIRTILNGLGIKELEQVEEFCELPGAYVNMECELPDKTIGKVLDDKAMYLCCQVPINDLECYGVAADEKQVVVYRYKNNDSEAKVVKIITL